MNPNSHLDDGLFRKIGPANNSALGINGSIRGVSTWVLIVAIGASLGVGLFFLTKVSFARTVTVPGELRPASGLIRVVAEKSGVVEKIYVSEQDSLAPGAPILRVAASNVLESGAAASREVISSIERRINGLHATALESEALAKLQVQQSEQKVSSLAKEGAQLKEAIALQAQRLSLAEKNLAAVESLAMEDLISRFDLRALEEKVLAEMQALLTLRRQAMQAETSLEAEVLRASALRTEIKLRRVQLASDTEVLKERLVSAQSADGEVLTARVSGSVTAINAKLGDAIAPGDVLAMIVPDDSSLVAELWVPSSAIGILKEGSKVRLMYDAFPYQRFGVQGGVVELIDTAPTPVADLPVQFQDSEPRYRVLVRPDSEAIFAYGSRHILRAGGILKADLILEDRSLWSWLLDPVLASRQRLTNQGVE